MLLAMFADLVDEHEQKEGRRQEGMFSAGMTFSIKASSSLGIMISGIVLEHFVGFDQSIVGQTFQEIDDAVIFKLAITDSLIINSLFAFSLVFIKRYTLTRESLSLIQDELAKRR